MPERVGAASGDGLLVRHPDDKTDFAGQQAVQTSHGLGLQD
jgi:hypothetical protein